MAAPFLRCQDLFERLFHKQVSDAITVGVFLVVPDSLRWLDILQVARARGFDIDVADVPHRDWRTLVDPAHRVRLLAYQGAVVGKQGDRAWPDHLFVNVSQNAKFAGASLLHTKKSMFPTLIKNSIIVDIGQQHAGAHGRLVHPLEHWVAMGWPVFCEDTDRRLPVPLQYLQQVTSTNARHLTGNAMHAVAIGTWLQFLLAVLEEPAR